MKLFQVHPFGYVWLGCIQRRLRLLRLSTNRSNGHFETGCRTVRRRNLTRIWPHQRSGQSLPKKGRKRTAVREIAFWHCVRGAARCIYFTIKIDILAETHETFALCYIANCIRNKSRLKIHAKSGHILCSHRVHGARQFFHVLVFHSMFALFFSASVAVSNFGSVMLEKSVPLNGSHIEMSAPEHHAIKWKPIIILIVRS